MRFHKWPRPEPYQLTPRKIAPAVRSQRMQREKVPLFAEMVAAEQPTVDEEMQRRKEGWLANQKEARDRCAESWRNARAKLATYGDDIRPVIRQLWDAAPYPGDPVYFLTMMHSIDVGRIDPNHPPWRLTPDEIEAGRAAIERYTARRQGASQERSGDVPAR